LGIEDTILSRPAGASDQMSGKAGEFQFVRDRFLPFITGPDLSEVPFVDHALAAK
jgi:hypothetical protein